MSETISTLDLCVIAAYFLLVVAIGIWTALRTKTDEDLFLGGRSLTWGFIGLSLFASNISSTTLIGLTGAAYGSGIAVSNYEWLSGLPLIVAAAVFIPIYLRARITTVPEYLELRYDRRSRVLFSATTILISIIVDTAGGLYAGAVVLKTFVPDLVLWHATLGLALFAGIYTAFGGLRAVVYTDSLQAIILLSGGFMLTFVMFQKLDFSWAAVQSAPPPGRLSVIRPIDDPGLPWLGTVVGVPLLGFWYWVTNQYVTQRILAAKNVDHARWGVLFAGFLKLLPLFIMVLPGAMAMALLPPIENPDMVFSMMVGTMLPAGVVGLVLAGLVSAIMSSVDSTLNSASTLIVKDFVEREPDKHDARRIARYGRITTLLLMAFAATWAPLIQYFGGLWSYLQQVFSIIVPPVATVFLLGVFLPRGSAGAAFYTLILGFFFGLLLFVLGQFDLWTLHFSINVGIAFAVSVTIFLLFTFMAVEKQGPQPDQLRRDELVFRSSMVAPIYRGSLLADYRLLSGLLVLAMGAILIGFW